MMLFVAVYVLICDTCFIQDILARDSAAFVEVAHAINRFNELLSILHVAF